MFGCYRRTEAADAGTYVAAVALVLAHYSAAVVDAVTDPFAGLPSQKKENGYSGLPDVADVKEACEDEAARQLRMSNYQAMGKTQFQRLQAPRNDQPGVWANVLVRSDHPSYPKLLKRTETADDREWKIDERGLHVSLAWFEGQTGGVTAKPFKQFTDDELRKMYSPMPEAAE